ncbi:MAG: ABC transporter ATP-binding protein [Rhodothermales bacterium]
MLEIKDLVKVYPGPVAALQGVQLEIPKGMFGLLGPNGSGKSTMMRILAGLLEPTSGAILLNGVDITKNPAYVWARLGYLPQDFGFYPNLTGEAVLLHMLRLKGVEAPKGLKHLAAALMERVNLSAAAKRKVKTYSGGMRQRLGIAQAIAGQPELIIVDEPTAGLDPEERIRFYRLLSELAEDRTVLLTTHIVEDVAVLCPQFAVIRKGNLITTTSPSKACTAIEGTIFEGSVGKEELVALSETGRVTRAYLFEGQNRIRIHVADDAVPAGFNPVPPTLEDAYMLMQKGSETVSEFEGHEVAK